MARTNKKKFYRFINKGNLINDDTKESSHSDSDDGQFIEEIVEMSPNGVLDELSKRKRVFRKADTG